MTFTRTEIAFIVLTVAMVTLTFFVLHGLDRC